MKNNFYAVIMAGGTGTRLWPVSRKEKPKQFQKFTSSRLTMIQETYERVSKIVTKDNIFVSTTEAYKSLTLEQLPEINRSQLIIEPLPRGTAAAIALVAKKLQQKNPKAVVATVASDHVIKNVDEFISLISTALEVTEKHRDKFLTVGVNPTFPDTRLGYIKIGKEFSNSNKRRIFYVNSFVEKPDKIMAEKYVSEWDYLWNASYFIFSAKNFLGWVKNLTPEIAKVIAIDDAKKMSKEYINLENIPIDTAIVEKMDGQSRLVIPSELQWSDVGSWGELFDFYKDGSDSKSKMVVKGNHVDVDSKDCLVYAQDKLVATIGLKNIIIVETDDAILVANRNNVSEVKKIIEKLKTDGKHLYL